MERIMGIDFGRKRVGVAVSDPLGIFASGIDTIATAKIITYIQSYMQKETIGRFVVGYPKNLNNTPAEAAQYVDVFLRQLAKVFPRTPISLEDERYTSKMAFQSMIDGGVKKRDRQNKATVDKVSAALILQSYLDNKNSSIQK